MGDAWEDEGYPGEDDWGEESVAADLEEELLEPGEDGEDGEDHAEDDLDEALLDLDEGA